MTHTPTPLRIVESGLGIDIVCPRGNVCHMTAGYGQTQLQDAQDIIKACNAHDELVAALKACLIILRSDSDMEEDYEEEINQAVKALTKAEKGV